jgi:hypothetical protein
MSVAWCLAATTGIDKFNVWRRAKSERDKDRFYNVGSEEGLMCDCPDIQNRGEVCKHAYAIMIRGDILG